MFKILKICVKQNLQYVGLHSRCCSVSGFQHNSMPFFAEYFLDSSQIFTNFIVTIGSGIYDMLDKTLKWKKNLSNNNMWHISYITYIL